MTVLQTSWVSLKRELSSGASKYLMYTGPKASSFLVPWAALGERFLLHEAASPVSAAPAAVPAQTSVEWPFSLVLAMDTPVSWRDPSLLNATDNYLFTHLEVRVTLVDGKQLSAGPAYKFSEWMDKELARARALDRAVFLTALPLTPPPPPPFVGGITVGSPPTSPANFHQGVLLQTGEPVSFNTFCGCLGKSGLYQFAAALKHAVVYIAPHSGLSTTTKPSARAAASPTVFLQLATAAASTLTALGDDAEVSLSNTLTMCDGSEAACQLHSGKLVLKAKMPVELDKPLALRLQSEWASPLAFYMLASTSLMPLVPSFERKWTDSARGPAAGFIRMEWKLHFRANSWHVEELTVPVWVTNNPLALPENS